MTIRRCSLLVALTALVAVVLSTFPFAQRSGDPSQAVYAGRVGTERTEMMLLGLAMVAIGIAIFWSGVRWLLLGSATSAALIGILAVQTIARVAVVTADDSEIVSEVGWALYALCMCAVIGVVLSLVGVAWSRDGTQRV